jgi:ribosome-binding protein aMBF1 (putative translation factor)
MSSVAILASLPAGFARTCGMPKEIEAYSELARGYGQRLAATRRALGMSARDLQDLLNVSKARLNHWENERHLPDITAMLALKRLRGVSLDWIFAGDPSGLPSRILQHLVTAGAAADAPIELVKLRAQFSTPGQRATMHEPPPKRIV